MGPLHSIHFTLVLSIPPLLSTLTSPTLLSTYYHFLRKPNWRAGLHNRYECLSDQTCFGFLVCCHLGSQLEHLFRCEIATCACVTNSRASCCPSPLPSPLSSVASLALLFEHYENGPYESLNQRAGVYDRHMCLMGLVKLGCFGQLSQWKSKTRLQHLHPAVPRR